VPKINWSDDPSDDDQPLWERRYRPLRRDRLMRRQRPIFPTSPTDRLPLLLRQSLIETQTTPARKPLHLIWGEPKSSRAEPSP
jgi:hypothetical protein